MRPIPSAALAAASVFALSAAVLGQTAPESRPLAGAAADEIVPDAVAGPLSFLADDLLEGRGVGTRGDRLARAYLTSELRAIGLRPGAADGTYAQDVPITGIRSVVTTPLSAAGPNGVASFVAPDDCVIQSYRPEAESSWESAEVVFVGFGIAAPEWSWDDFKDVDVRGKVLLVMNDDPSSDPALFAGKTRLYYGRWTYKFEEAARRGAAGVLLIHTVPSAGYPFQVIQATHEQERFWLPFDKEPELRIAAWISEDAARRLCKLGGKDLDALREPAETRAFRPTPLGVKASVVAKNTVRPVESGNVIARLDGGDPSLRDECVVVTAHFDHLGIGAPKGGDAIYNGALDNASGCAAMTALAKALVRRTPRPRRSVLFAAVTGEESGLIGSEWFARRPPVPAKRLVADFNLDGINMWGRTRDVQLIGYGKSTLQRAVEAAAARQGRVVLPDSEPDKGLFYRSDHFSLARIGVPSVYLKSGQDFLEDKEAKRRVQLAYTAFHYHQPSDQFDARWNLDGAVEDLRLLLDALVETADADQAPRWTPGDEFEKRR